MNFAPAVRFMRVPLQDWQNCAHYLPRETWDCLSDAGRSDDVQLFAFMQAMLKLGLRNPSEPACKVMASLMLICMKGFQAATEMKPNDKYEFLNVFRARFKSELQVHMNQPTESLDDPPLPSALHQSPTEFQILHPRWFTLAFGQPCRCVAQT